MTREEAREFLTDISYKLGNMSVEYLSEKDGEKMREAIKTLEQESTKTGHWIVDGSVDCYLEKVRCHCSECGKKKEFPADYDHIKHKLSISYRHSEFIDNYCPNCGIKIVEQPQERSDKK